ncbi:MAG TPA: hypothetical protein VK400_18030 [Pyrinomonadaceae bacterium]|nr:hypothetical protein [Pyrinomonadaceae bacterium]
MRNFAKLKIALLIICLCAPLAAAQNPKNYTDEEAARSGKLFEEGNDLMEQKKPAEALAKFKQSLAVVPDALGALYNGGLAAFQTKDFEQAISMWKRLKELDAQDWQVRAKLVQAYQALGKMSERDAERRELFDLRKNGKIEELKKAEFYVREQSEFAGQKVMVFEHFELKGDRALRYVFYILDENEKIQFRISLGSYAFTNAIWRETTKPKPKDGERLFHLDGYYSWGHATFGMYPKEPTYDETREIVRQILAKEKKPVSSSTVGNPPPKQEKPE